MVNLQGDVSDLCSSNLTKEALASPRAATAAGQLVVHTHLIPRLPGSATPSSDLAAGDLRGRGPRRRSHPPQLPIWSPGRGWEYFSAFHQRITARMPFNPHCVLQVLLVKSCGRKGCQRDGNLRLIPGLVPWHRGHYTGEQSLREAACWQINWG